MHLHTCGTEPTGFEDSRAVWPISAETVGDSLGEGTTGATRRFTDWTALLEVRGTPVLVLTTGSHEPMALPRRRPDGPSLSRKPIALSEVEGQATSRPARRLGVRLWSAT